MPKHSTKWLYVGFLIVIAGCGAPDSGTDATVNDVGNIVGTVTNAATNDILSGVTVQIGDKTEVTGNNGDYVMQDVAVGSWTVTASKSEYQNHNGTCTVTKGTTNTYNIQMSALTASDTTPPSITSTSPANNATDITVNSAISATFTEAMDVSTISSSTFTVSSGGNTVSGTVTYSGTTATFTPSSNLAYSTIYTATITTGVKDSAGNAMAAAYTWTFTTGSAPDTTAPTVSSTSPANSSTGVAVNTAITATFSEVMTASTVNTSTFTIAGVTGAVTYTGTTATFTPSSNLAYSTTYTATITTGVKDSAGNAMAAAYTWTFTTGSAPDTTPPTVLSTSPANGATGVAINTAITATFSETMMASTITTASFTLNNGVTGTVTYSGTTATFTPSSNLAYSTTYTAAITTGVKDSAGNAMAAAYTWTFITGIAFKMPDTNQTTSYTSTFGEDHDYIINPPSYTDNGDGTITDNVTGLMWQKQDDGTTRTWDDAVTYCSNLSLAGQTEWRLPDQIELISIIDNGVYSPSINTTFFPSTISSDYWSSTTDANFTSNAWHVLFFNGTSVNTYKTNSFYVRCVRGGQTTPSLTDNGNGTVTGNETHLIWQQGESSTMTWEAALSYCEGLYLAGYTDWRLPNHKELLSLVDDTRYNPSINTTFFPGTISSSYYWSSTTNAYYNYTSSAWVVNFNNGYSDYYGKTGLLYVRCVRGGQ